VHEAEYFLLKPSFGRKMKKDRKLKGAVTNGFFRKKKIRTIVGFVVVTFIFYFFNLI